MLEDYPVQRRSQEDLERAAGYYRKLWGLGDKGRLCVYSLLFERMPEKLAALGLKIIMRSSSHMGDREAYAVPATKRIFIKKTLAQKLRFGDRQAAAIMLHELAHVLLHPGAPKAWMTKGNATKKFIEEECSAEQQATTFALCLLAPIGSAKDCGSAEQLAERFGLTENHARARFEAVRRRGKRQVPKIYDEVIRELRGENPPPTFVNERCCTCGEQKLIEIAGLYRCSACGRVSSHFQDGDVVQPPV